MNNNLVFFSSFEDQYSDHPKAISEKVHELYPDVLIVWPFSDRAKLDRVPEYVIKVKINSVRHAILKNRAKVIIDNYTGIYNVFTEKRNSWKYKLLIKKRQINFSTWHGTPLKKIGRSMMNRGKDVFISTSSGFILNSKYITEILHREFDNTIPVHLLGSARNDLLFEKDTDKLQRIKTHLGLDSKCQYVLYAPTFRYYDGFDSKPYSLYMSSEQIDMCIAALKSRFGGEWAFIIRVHQKIKEQNTELFNGKTVINGNEHDDMAEYLAVCDILITDFSGSLFDFANTNKPCFLYAPDFFHYKNKERGLYLDVQKLPYTFTISDKELVENILNYDSNEQITKVYEFNKYLGNIDDGKASERIAHLIYSSLTDDKLHFKRKQQKNVKKNKRINK
jgi:CDP-glycerol glycerophosphotransferase